MANIKCSRVFESVESDSNSVIASRSKDIIVDEINSEGT